MDDEYEMLLWYFDDNRKPCCSSTWKKDICTDNTECLFSHKSPKFQARILISIDFPNSLSELFFYISNYSLINLTEESFEKWTLPDFSKSSYDNHKLILCPILVEFGHCQNIETCEYPHSLDDLKALKLIKSQEFYQNSINCECCKGFIYGCLTEQCKNRGRCEFCIDIN